MEVGGCTKWKFMMETRWLLSLSTLEIIRPSFFFPATDEIYHNYWKTLLIITFPVLMKIQAIPVMSLISVFLLIQGMAFRFNKTATFYESK